MDDFNFLYAFVYYLSSLKVNQLYNYNQNKGDDKNTYENKCYDKNTQEKFFVFDFNFFSM